MLHPVLVAAAGLLLLSCSDGRTPPSDSKEIFIQGGSFWMGSEAGVVAADPALAGTCTAAGLAAGSPAECYNDQKSRRCVGMSSFKLDETEVSNIQYDHCVARGYCSEPRYDNSGDYGSYTKDRKFDHYPVVHVTWFQSQEYCTWRGKRLPTEAEWEYAAKGRKQRAYPWGNASPPYPVINNNCDELGANFALYWKCRKDAQEVPETSNGSPWPVAQFLGDKTADGVLNMAGNVIEWVADWYAEKGYCGAADCTADDPSCVMACQGGEPFCATAPADQIFLNPTGPATGDQKVARGGSFKWNSCRLETSYRYRGQSSDLLYPTNQLESLGFRCLRELYADGEACSESTECVSGSCVATKCAPVAVAACAAP